MTTLYHPFPLKCFDKLKEETLTYMDQFHVDNIYVKLISLTPELTNIFNLEMAEYGLPDVWNFLAFKRKNFFSETPSVHIDYSVQMQKHVHSSIVLPLMGCEDTSMYWMDGIYVLEEKNITGSTNYMHLKWKQPPKFIDRVEISKEPFLTKVDVPHSVTSRKDGSYRTVLTIRLQGNPTFDEIIKKRFDNKSQM